MYTGLNYYIHKSLDNGNGALWLVPSQLDLSSYVEKFKMAAKFAEPTEVEIAGPAEPVRFYLQVSNIIVIKLHHPHLSTP